MIIPADATIAVEKVRDYLLKPLDVDDKSGYLALAGYTREDYWELMRDIRSQLLPAEGTFQKSNQFGEYYIVPGRLHGPNGRRLSVNSIWLKDNDDPFKFVTLRPRKGLNRDEI